MTPDIKPLVAGNWKMNGMVTSMNELGNIAAGYTQEMKNRIDTLICTPSTLTITAAHVALGTGVAVGGQDCHANASGAHTGDISAEMLFNAGATAVIVGHSERRTDHGESNATIKAKAEAGLRAGLLTIVCIGETEAQRKSGETLAVLKDQLDGSMPDGSQASDVVVAYEPVWAIGTGLVPSIDDIKEAHVFIRENLSARFGDEGAKMRLLYGGSVKPSNAVELMAIANVDGALVGGASLKADDFLGICTAYNELA